LQDFFANFGKSILQYGICVIEYIQNIDLKRDNTLNNFVYTEEPGILYDMLFVLRLRINGERVLQKLRTNDPAFEEHEGLYHKIIHDMADLSDNLLSLFYNDDANGIKTAIISYFYQKMDYTNDNLIERFYDSLRDT